MSKGSVKRPLSVPRKVFESEWDRIFNPQPAEKKEKTQKYAKKCIKGVDKP